MTFQIIAHTHTAIVIALDEQQEKQQQLKTMPHWTVASQWGKDKGQGQGQVADMSDDT